MDLRYLTENYIPNKVLFRDEQINILLKSFDDYQRFGASDNFLISGRTGTGKTATLKHLSNLNSNFVYVSGIHNTKSIKVLRILSNLKIRNESDLLNKFIHDLNNNPKALIVDEIDKIRDYKELINWLNAIYREVPIPIIIATNNLKFIKTMPEDARLTLLFQHLSFSPYCFNELYLILKDRLNLASAEIPEDKLNLMVAISGKEGSARLLLKITLSCLKEDNFEIEFIKEKVKQFEDGELKEYILKNINTTDKQILRELFAKHEEGKEIISRDLSESLKISKSRMTNILDNFEINLGLIESISKNEGGRKGKIRKIIVDQDAYNLLKNCKEI